MPEFWLRILRSLSMLDGASFIYLLFHSIYSKRIMGDDEAIQIPGMMHGIIFCVLAASLAVASRQLKWPISRTVLVIVCAFIPLAPFFLEVSLKKEQKSLSTAE